MKNMGKLLKQAASMQKDLQKKQAELAEKEVEFSSGGGAVKATATCDLQIRSIKIDPSAVDPDDVEMLEDLVTSAVDGALGKARETMQSELGGIAGGLGGGLPM
ncbi:YbaB/EbfC family nucleoid-associated protein [Kiritimatiella glycovorans]|uniref:Nucleoid-associated protein L21SP4_00517 n=1 Tax=Kiritimatiella glycovorans TaxID=1307763 RepID=A0A0G3EHY0_9BACT|nr:YbaB/EbfC family nucleoid-associated protein [Kiritimatiella glycovorans]AKJ63789.1 Nucleoid-associated protein [Kiritimatiella glycovorans]